MRFNHEQNVCRVRNVYHAQNVCHVQSVYHVRNVFREDRR